MRKIPFFGLVGVFLLSVSASAVMIGDNCYSQPIVVGVGSGFDPALVRGANSGWTRFTIQWRQVNPQSGVWDWNLLDSQVTNFRNQGIKILAILSTAPTWAGSNANGTTPPSNIALWEEFVRRVAQRYSGRIEAYEIWNEPNLQNSGVGVGWNKSLASYPRYVDYLRAAAIQIRAYAPGTLIVAPVTSSQPDSRTVEIFKQLEQTYFPEGPAHKFMDVVSFHANAGDNENVFDKIRSHESTILNRNPSNIGKPIWLTEFGWKSNRVGEAGQRDRIRELVEWLTGGAIDPFFECGENAGWKWTHVFIYKDIDTSTESSGIYRGDRTPKPVVTDYLRTLPFPAKHPNNVYAPFTSSCLGRTCTFTSSITQSGARYDWDFGDGMSGTGRTITHTFPAAGQYFVSHGASHPDFPGWPGWWGSDLQLIRVN